VGAGETVSLVAGTFDRLHVAHITLLYEAFKLGTRILIGVVENGSQILEYKIGKPIEPYRVRVGSVRSVAEILSKLMGGRVYEIIPIKGPYDIVLDRENIDYIVVSEETFPRALKINLLREKAGMNPLKIVVIPIIHSEDGRPVSSHRIRLGELNRYGDLILNFEGIKEVRWDVYE